MEELLVYAILFYEEIVVTEELLQKKLDLLFLESPDNEMLLNLEWETDIRKAMVYIRTYFDYQNLKRETFGTLSYADDPLSWGDEKQTKHTNCAFRYKCLLKANCIMHIV